MAQVNNLIEWDYLGSHFSVYIKHYTDDDGRKGMTMIFEDVTHEKVTEMVIPSRSFPAFLKAVNGAPDRYRPNF
jgi:hypothetical protein